jgi:hypothetical protein
MIIFCKKNRHQCFCNENRRLSLFLYYLNEKIVFQMIFFYLGFPLDIWDHPSSDLGLPQLTYNYYSPQVETQMVYNYFSQVES